MILRHPLGVWNVSAIDKGRILYFTDKIHLFPGVETLSYLGSILILDIKIKSMESRIELCQEDGREN